MPWCCAQVVDDHHMDASVRGGYSVAQLGSSQTKPHWLLNTHTHAHTRTQTIDTIFIAADTPAPGQSSILRRNMRKALVRFEMMEALVRLALARYKGHFPAKAFRALMQLNLYPHAQRDHPELYRSDDLMYTEEVGGLSQYQGLHTVHRGWSPSRVHAPLCSTGGHCVARVPVTAAAGV